MMSCLLAMALPVAAEAPLHGDVLTLQVMLDRAGFSSGEIDGREGRNLRVGMIWIDITREHYGIHGTPEPSRIGHVQSHGCVRLTNWDVQRVAQWARPGTRVVFR